MNQEHMMYGVGLGVMLFFGCGLMWVMSGEIDCTQIKIKENRDSCKSFTNFGNNMPIGMIGGLMLVIGSVGFKLIDDKYDKPQTNSRSSLV